MTASALLRVSLVVAGMSLGCRVAGAQGRAAQPRSPTAKVPLGTVLTAFLADSGIRTRGLAWTTGDTLPVKWESPSPKPAAAYLHGKGITLTRAGSFVGTVGDSVALPMMLSVSGTAAGLARVDITIPSMSVDLARGGGFFLTREMVEQALVNEGLSLQPLKCKRAVEGASYGNLVDALKAPGKTASGLWWAWESPRQEMRLSLSILYRRADMSEVECQGG